MAGVELDSVSGGLSESELGEMRDISAQHFIRFDEQNPETTTDRTLVIKNTTWVSKFLLEISKTLNLCSLLIKVAQTVGVYPGFHSMMWLECEGICISSHDFTYEIYIFGFSFHRLKVFKFLLLQYFANGFCFSFSLTSEKRFPRRLIVVHCFNFTRTFWVKINAPCLFSSPPCLMLHWHSKEKIDFEPLIVLETKVYLLYIVFRNVALPFCWKLYKPFFKCPVPLGVPVQPSVTSSHVIRTRDDHGVFKITPNMGTLPPNESVDFMLEFAPREVLKLITVI